MFIILWQSRRISHRIKIADTELRECNERFRLLLENIDTGVFLSTLTGQFLQVNQAVVRIAGYDDEQDFMRISARQLYADPRDREVLLARLQKDGAIRNFEVRSLKKDGTVYWVSMNISFVSGSSYEQPILLGTVYDITERKQAEEAMYANDFLLKQSQRIARLGHYVLNLRSGLWTSSEMLDEIFGMAAQDERTVDSWTRLVHPSHRQQMLAYFTQHVVEQKLPFDKEYKICRLLNGETRWVHGLGELEFDAEGKPIKMFGTIQDITAKKNVEDALHEKQAFIAALVEALPDALSVIRPDGARIMVNQAFIELSGFTREELLNSPPPFSVWPPEHRETIKQAFDRLLKGEMKETELVFMRKNGERFPVLLSPSYMRDENGKFTHFMTTMKDITMRKRTEAALQNAQKIESLGVLAGGIAHDFNNLLGEIFGYIHLAKERSKEGHVASDLGKALATMTRARGLSQQLLTFAKGGAPVKKVAHLFPFVQETALFALSGSNVSCRFEVSPDIRPGNFDREQIGRVIDNMVINAKQAMPKGGTIVIAAANVTLKENEVAALPAGDYIRISIKDSGVGIPAENLPHIFDPFFTTKPTGSGLGLSTCFSIVKRHDGAIQVESAPNMGTIFHVYLPASDGEPVPVPEQSIAAHQGAGTILIMDDEKGIREITVRWLRSFGYNVVTSKDGQEALAIFTRGLSEKRRFIAIILDLTVPGGMGGQETVAALRKIDAQIPIFVASGYANDQAMSDPVKYGFTDSIGKPFIKSELLDLLRKYLPSA